MAVMLYHHIQQQIELADTKSEFILAANAILAATVTSLYRGMATQIFNNQFPLANRPASLLGLLMFLTLIISFYYALMVARPKLKVPLREEENLYFFGGIQLYTGEEFAKKFLALQKEQIAPGILKQTYTISHIAYMKFMRIRKSIDFLIAALALWGLSHLAMAFVPGGK